MFNATVISQILWTSLATSSYFVLFALAFALVLKVNKVFNFAQAGMMTAGFYAAYVVTRVLGLPGALGFAGAILGGDGAVVPARTLSASVCCACAAPRRCSSSSSRSSPRNSSPMR
jgi:branched-subunit amino acid ABC-type transport system permease component